MEYSGRVHKDLREDLVHRVTVTQIPADERDMYDDEGNPVDGPQITNIPSLWVEKTKVMAGPDGNKSIVAYVTCYLPHDMPIKIGEKIKNESTGRELTVVQVRPPIDERDHGLPYTAWLE